jgi:hypothetical protein
MENIYRKLIIKLAYVHLKYAGNVDLAYDEFNASESDELSIEEIIKLLYEEKVELLKITTFAFKFNRSASSYTAINTLCDEMGKDKQLEQIEFIPLYLKITNFINDLEFKTEPHGLKKQYHALRSKLSRTKENIIDSIVNDIITRSFDRPNDMINNITKKLSLQDAESFLADVVKQYLASTNTSQLEMLLDFIQISNTYTVICNFYKTIWQKLLQRSGINETMEALMVWSRAYELVRTRNLSSGPCWDIANSSASAYQQTLLFSNYTNYVKNGKIGEIINLHRTYGMKYFFDKYITSLQSFSEFENHSIKLFDAIDALPNIADTCYAAAAFYQESIIQFIFDSALHFRMLQIVKRIVNSSDFANLDKVSKAKCESVQSRTPAVFRQVLHGTTFNCSLLNRYYDLEPLFCANLNRTEQRYRNVYLEMEPDVEAYKFWNITVHSAGGVHLINHANFTLRYTGSGGNVTASDTHFDPQLDYFRLRVKDNDYILFEPASGKFYRN